MKRKDLVEGETYLASPSSRESYGVEKVRVVTTRPCRERTYWQRTNEGARDIKFDERMKQLLESEDELAPKAFRKAKEALVVERDQAAAKTARFAYCDSGTGVLVDVIERRYDPKNPPEAVHRMVDSGRTHRQVVETREFRRPWAEEVANEKASVEYRKKAAAAQREREQALEDLKASFTQELEDLGFTPGGFGTVEHVLGARFQVFAMSESDIKQAQALLTIGATNRRVVAAADLG